MTKGHGRIETRSIWTSTDLVGYSDFPYLAQSFCIHRHTTDLDGIELRSECAYGVTSLTTDKAKPADILDFNRRHWSIENKVHWVLDVGFREDDCRVRQGYAADLLVVNGNPLENLKVLYPTGVDEVVDGRVKHTGGVEWTIKDGIPYHGPTLLKEVKEIVAKARQTKR